MQKFRQDLEIGSNIAKLRIRAGFTQEETVAKMQLLGCTLSRSVYSQIECGTYNIRISEFLAMKNIFNASFEEFFEGVSLVD